MKNLALIAVLLIQGVPPPQQGGMIIGHLTRGIASTVVGTPIVARAIDDGRVAGIAVSDETGGYRLSLPAGHYAVSAGLLSSPTYYPGVADQVNARAVKVVAGSTVVGIDFSLVKSVDIPVAGRVVIEGGGSLPADVAGLIGSALPANNRPVSAALMRMLAQQAPGGVRSSVTVRDDGTFALALPPGGNQVFVQALPLGYYVKSIVAGGMDILQSPLIVSEGAQEIVVTLTRTAPSSSPPAVTVSGRVSDLPADTSSKWVILQANPGTFGVPSMIAEIPIQADGTFHVAGVPPGNYNIGPFQQGQQQRPLAVPSDGVRGVEVTWGVPRAARAAPSRAPIPTVAVRGRIDVIPGAAVPRNVQLTSATTSQATKVSSVNNDGTFAFTEVAPAMYELRVGTEPLSGVRNFSVGNQDIVGIEIKAVTETHGRVVMADGSKPPSLEFQIKNEYDAGGAGTAPRAMMTIQREFDVQDNGTFSLGVVRGEQRISVLGIPAAYTVKSIKYGSTDLLDQPLILSAPPSSEILVTLEETGIPVPRFRFVYQFGRAGFFHSNSLDSLRGTFTKDMIEDPPRTFNLSLTEEELAQIERKLDDIDFWNGEKYPPVFTMPNPSDTGCMTTGRQPIYLFVIRGETTKELTWLDQDTLCGGPNPAGADLRSFTRLIQSMLDAKSEFRNLPRARGMYID
jgi:hypothetical protein